MAASDAKPIPRKNVAYRVTFPILDNDGDLVTGAASLDSEISKDGGTFADCTNEATEIATSSGVYYLDLTATEMNADTVAIIVKTTTTDAKTTTIVMYPEEAGDIRVNVTQVEGSDATDQINAACDSAIETYGLDHLVSASVAGADVADNSIVAKLVSKEATADWDDFVNTTDSLQALRDQGDSAWITATGFSTHNAAAVADAVWDESTTGHTTAGTFGEQVKTDIDAILADTDSLEGTKIPDTLSLANINSQVDTALSDIGLDHLLSASVTGTDVTNNSVIAKLVSASATADWDDFVNTTDSLQAIRDRGDSAWTTGGGASITDILNVQSLIPESIDLANTATWQLGLMLTNALDDLPSAAEITPGTISIDRKAIGGTSWTSVVSDAACSESAGLIYYDEVFDSGTGYAEGDSIRITFKSQKIVVSANDYEITGSGGVIFYTEIRQTMRGTDSAPTAAAIADAVWDESTTGHTTAGTFGEQVKTDIDAILVDTNSLEGTKIPDTLSLANINAQVDDVLSTDTQAELSAVPGASPTIKQMIQWVYQRLKHKETTTSTTTTHFKDDGSTSLGTSTVSDDGTTFTRGEFS